MALSGDNPFIAIDAKTGLPLPGQDVRVPETEEEIERWHAVRRAWAAFSLYGDKSLLREVCLLPREEGARDRWPAYESPSRASPI